jgi:LacI family transcriptional regulator
MGLNGIAYDEGLRNAFTMKKATRPSGIKEIARKLGVSIGTVDRALHDRNGISKKTRAMILATAERMNYRPNLAARNLKLNRKLRVAVCLPEEITWFFDPLREGIRARAGQAAGIAVDLDFRSYPRIGDGDAALGGSLAKGYDAALISPGNPAEFKPLIARLTELGTAVFCVASDAPGSPRVASVRADAEVCGGIAAELLAKALGNRGTVAAITGDLTAPAHNMGNNSHAHACGRGRYDNYVAAESGEMVAPRRCTCSPQRPGLHIPHPTLSTSLILWARIRYDVIFA